MMIGRLKAGLKTFGSFFGQLPVSFNHIKPKALNKLFSRLFTNRIPAFAPAFQSSVT